MATLQPQDKVQYIDYDKIVCEDRAREDMGDLKTLAESISEKGVIQPITVRALPDGRFRLLAGGRRWAASGMVQLKKVPALIRTRRVDDEEIDSLEIELLENKARKDFTFREEAALVKRIHDTCAKKNMNWSARKTAQVMGHDHAMNVSRSLKVAEALEHMPELVEDCKTQDDVLKRIKSLEEKVVVQELRKRQEQTMARGMGDMLKIAKANYRIGDALKELAALPSGLMFHLIEVDPPYGIDLNEQKKQENIGNLVETYKEVDLKAYPAFLQTVARETYRVAYKDAWMIFWYGPTHHQLVLDSLRQAGWEVDDIPGIWNKGHGQTNAPEIYLARSYEPFFICRKGKPVLAKRGRANVFSQSPVAAVKKYHPTERPVELMEELLSTFGIVGQGVLIPFLGSGVTLRACYKLGMKGMGWDLNGEYKDKFLLAVEDDTRKLDAEAEEDA